MTTSHCAAPPLVIKQQKLRPQWNCLAELALCVCAGVFYGQAHMAAGDQYRIKAASFHARALCTRSPRLRIQYENLSKAYLRLAEQADRNDMTEIIYEPPPPNQQSRQEIALSWLSLRRLHAAECLELKRNVRYWPKADISYCTAHVRFRGLSGHGLLSRAQREMAQPYR